MMDLGAVWVIPAHLWWVIRNSTRGCDTLSNSRYRINTVFTATLKYFLKSKMKQSCLGDYNCSKTEGTIDGTEIFSFCLPGKLVNTNPRSQNL